MTSSQEFKLPRLANEKECTGCFACKSSCQVGAICSVVSEDGHVYVSVDRSRCVGCLKCERVCLQSRRNHGKNDIKESLIYAGWTYNRGDRQRGTSGGIFPALARYVIETGGCVVGAYLDGKECKHIIIDNVHQIQGLQGSKYLFSSLDGIYEKIEKELKNRDVLFTGVGCQCAGILAYFEGKNYTHHLYTVDLVCGGAPSKLLIEKFYENNPNIEYIKSFRKKDKYCLTVQTREGEKEYTSKNLPLHGFNCGMTSRICCYNCQFAKAHRKTDLTIGDLWDYNIYPNEHHQGISMIIVHNDSGENLINSSCVKIEEIPWNGALLNNKRTVCGFQHLFFPRKHLIYISQKLSYEKFVKLYCISMKPSNCIFFLFRIYRFLVMKYDSYAAKKEIMKLLDKGCKEQRK